MLRMYCPAFHNYTVAHIYGYMYNRIIMRTEHFAATLLENLFEKQKVATLPELQSALGCQARMTVFRKLNALSYLSSYSHAGRYYTLPQIAQWNDRGLWFCKEIRFSKEGTLKRTVERWVAGSEGGYFELELEKGLGVMVRGTLLDLLREDRLAREKVSGRYLYGSPEAGVRLRQTLARRSQEGYELPGPEALQHEIKAAILLFFSHLNEKQRRLYAGIESLKLGRGGDQQIAQWLGLHPQTIAKGREELLRRDIEIERIRRAGGGRPPLEKKRPKS